MATMTASTPRPNHMTQSPPTTISFAPNVTPGTFGVDDLSHIDDESEALLSASIVQDSLDSTLRTRLFPEPDENAPAPRPAKRRRTKKAQASAGEGTAPAATDAIGGKAGKGKGKANSSRSSTSPSARNSVAASDDESTRDGTASLVCDADAASPLADPLAAANFASAETSPLTSGAANPQPAHIPRPPNAFILFRSAFIRNQHVNAETESNHGKLSAIVGIVWQQLPVAERRLWQIKARKVLQEHRRMYPGYSFKPKDKEAAKVKKEEGVDEPEKPTTSAKGKKAKKGKKAAEGTSEPTESKKAAKQKRKRAVPEKDQPRVEAIANLLARGFKGAELQAAVQAFDESRGPQQFAARFEEPLTESAFRQETGRDDQQEDEVDHQQQMDAVEEEAAGTSSADKSNAVSDAPAPPSTSFPNPLPSVVSKAKSTSSSYGSGPCPIPAPQPIGLPSQASFNFQPPANQFTNPFFNNAPLAQQQQGQQAEDSTAPGAPRVRRSSSAPLLENLALNSSFFSNPNPFSTYDSSLGLQGAYEAYPVPDQSVVPSQAPLDDPFNFGQDASYGFFDYQQDFPPASAGGALTASASMSAIPSSSSSHQSSSSVTSSRKRSASSSPPQRRPSHGNLPPTSNFGTNIYGGWAGYSSTPSQPSSHAHSHLAQQAQTAQQQHQMHYGYPMHAQHNAFQHQEAQNTVPQSSYPGAHSHLRMQMQQMQQQMHNSQSHMQGAAQAFSGTSGYGNFGSSLGLELGETEKTNANENKTASPSCGRTVEPSVANAQALAALVRRETYSTSPFSTRSSPSVSTAQPQVQQQSQQHDMPVEDIDTTGMPDLVDHYDEFAPHSNQPQWYEGNFNPQASQRPTNLSIQTQALNNSGTGFDFASVPPSASAYPPPSTSTSVSSFPPASAYEYETAPTSAFPYDFDQSQHSQSQTRPTTSAGEQSFSSVSPGPCPSSNDSCSARTPQSTNEAFLAPHPPPPHQFVTDAGAFAYDFGGYGTGSGDGSEMEIDGGKFGVEMDVGMGVGVGVM